MNQELVLFSTILRTRTSCLTLETISSFLNSQVPGKQAEWKGRSLLTVSSLRQLTIVQTATNVSSSAMVETEYQSKKCAYLVTVILDTSTIVSASCCCIATNRSAGYCKH